MDQSRENLASECYAIMPSISNIITHPGHCERHQDGRGGVPAEAMTEKQLAAIERARHEPAVTVEIRRERKRSRSFTAQELIEFVQGNWADGSA
jgi:hypothetical protein